MLPGPIPPATTVLIDILLIDTVTISVEALDGAATLALPLPLPESDGIVVTSAVVSFAPQTRNLILNASGTFGSFTMHSLTVSRSRSS
jgi:hypothetical protein